jgi:hypothetical protein
LRHATRIYFQTQLPKTEFLYTFKRGTKPA